MSYYSSLIADVVRNVETPAFVIDEQRLVRDLRTAARLRDDCGFKLLYSIKPLTFEFESQWFDRVQELETTVVAQPGRCPQVANQALFVNHERRSLDVPDHIGN